MPCRRPSPAASLLQHLAQFQAANPDLEIRIETPPVNPDFRNSGHDLAVFHGELDLDADGLIADVRMRERFSLATPDLIKKAGWPDIKTMVAKAPLLHVRQGNDSWHDWRMLARQVGFAGLPVERGVVVETADQAVQAAMAGGGVVVVDPRLCAEEVAAGKLVAPFDISMLTGAHLHLVCRPDETELARISRLPRLGPQYQPPWWKRRPLNRPATATRHDPAGNPGPPSLPRWPDADHRQARGAGGPYRAWRWRQP